MRIKLGDEVIYRVVPAIFHFILERPSHKLMYFNAVDSLLSVTHEIYNTDKKFTRLSTQTYTPLSNGSSNHIILGG